MHTVISSERLVPVEFATGFAHVTTVGDEPGVHSARGGPHLHKKTKQWVPFVPGILHCFEEGTGQVVFFLDTCIDQCIRWFLQQKCDLVWICHFLNLWVLGWTCFCSSWVVVRVHEGGLLNRSQKVKGSISLLISLFQTMFQELVWIIFCHVILPMQVSVFIRLLPAQLAVGGLNRLFALAWSERDQLQSTLECTFTALLEPQGTTKWRAQTCALQKEEPNQSGK